MSELTNEQRSQMALEVIRDLLRTESGNLTPKQVFSIENELKRTLRSMSTNTKVYPDTNFCHYIHGRIIETEIPEDISVKSILDEIVDEALEEFYRNKEYWDNVKNTQMSSRVFRNLVNDFSDNESQKKLLETTHSTKSDLYDDGSLSKHARNLIKLKQKESMLLRHEREIQEQNIKLIEHNALIESHENDIKQLQNSVEESTYEVLSLKERIRRLEAKVDSANIDDKTWVIELSKRGYKKSEIIEITGISKTNVYRWLK